MLAPTPTPRKQKPTKKISVPTTSRKHLIPSLKVSARSERGSLPLSSVERAPWVRRVMERIPPHPPSPAFWSRLRPIPLLPRSPNTPYTRDMKKRPSSRIQLSVERKADLVRKISIFCENELDQELSPFQADELLRFFTETLGPQVYNQAIQDARGFMTNSLEDLDASLHERDDVS